MDRLIIVGSANMWRERNQTSPIGKVLAHIDNHRDGKSFDIVNASGIARNKV